MARWRTALLGMSDEREKALVGFAFLLSGDADLAPRLVEDALVATCARGRAPKGFGAPDLGLKQAIVSAYLRRDKLRRRREAMWQLVRPHAIPVPPGENLPQRDPLMAEMQSLPPRHRACVLLAVAEGAPLAVVATAVRVTPDEVSTYVRDAAAVLTRHFGPLDDIDDVTRESIRVSPQGQRFRSPYEAP
jgi:DNA-directed RNA polymerase specialized sigma24 family protein